MEKNKENNVELRQAQQKQEMINKLKETPIVQVACQKIGISRMTFYRWKKEDPEFGKQAEAAIFEGRFLVNDLAESQLISAVKEQSLPAITYWLRHHHPDYTNTIKIKHLMEDEALTPEQEQLVRKALDLASSANPDHKKLINKEQINELQRNSSRTSGGDDEGQKSPSENN